VSLQTDCRIQFPLLFPEQERVLSSESRFNIVSGADKCGKSTMAIDVLLTSKYGALNGYPVGFFLPDQDSLLTAKRRVLALIEPLLTGRLEGNHISLLNGGVIHFYSLDTDVRKIWEQVSLAVVDDAALVGGIYEVWEEVIEPALQRYRGSAWLFSKPRGLRSSFGRLFALHEQDSRWEAFILPTAANELFPAEDIERDREQMHPDLFRQERLGELIDAQIELSAAQSIIGRDETFRQWCERLAADGLKVDSHPFTLDDRPAMHFIYDMIPSTVAQANKRIDVIMKCAQVGFTVMEMLAMIYMALRFAPAKIGMFMPSQMLATGKSSERFMPIVRSVPPVYKMLVEEKELGRAKGEGNILIRNLGPSRFHFLWTSGKTATESFPMDVVSFDEVQEMQVADMEKTRERMSASNLRYTLMGSTANWPDRDIHLWYKKGSQHQFHTRCPHCDEFQVLDERFPECIGFDAGCPRLVQDAHNNPVVVYGDYRYVCHHCKGWISDPQQGEWRAKNPDAFIRSVHFPQLLSPTISPRDLIEAYFNADDMKNFYNRKLGKPYVDPSQVPVNLEMLNACATEGMRLGVQWEQRGDGYFMGIDQMGAFNVVLVAKRLTSGHLAIVHAEEIYSDDPFARCDELMAAFRVAVCVVETLPNYNDAKRFANRHKGRVFLAGYADMRDDMLRWGDAVPNRTERKTDEEERDRYTVTLDQYKCMQVAMARIQKMAAVFPDPEGLLQEITEKGGIRGDKKLTPILKDRVFMHFMRTALIAERDPEQNKYRRRVVKVGIDPHFSYAYMLLNVAWARAHGTSSFLFADAPEEVKLTERPGGIVNSPLINIVKEQTAAMLMNTCGACMSFNNGQCTERFVRVLPIDPACDLFVGA
jgi:hypothetical protein